MLAEERIIINRVEKKSTIREKVKSGVTFFLFILIGAVFGFCIAMALGSAETGKSISELVMVSVFLPSLLVSYIVHIAAHEFGHVMMGKLTGYQFHSYRIFSFMFLKEDGKWKLKRYTIPGTLGQAIMIPPEKKDGRFPWFLYNLGGGLVNLVLAIIALVIYLLNPHISGIVAIILLCFIMVGLITGALNLIPFPPTLMANDGSNMMAMAKDEIARECFYKQLSTVGNLALNKRFMDYPLEYYSLPKEANLKCQVIACIKNHELLYYYEMEDYNSAIKFLNTMEQVEGLPKILKLSFDAERLFFECLQGPREEVVEALCYKELLNVLKQGKSMLDMQRILMAYEGLYHKDVEKAKMYYNRARKLLESYPIKCVVDIEKRFLDEIKEKMEAPVTKEVEN